MYDSSEMILTALNHRQPARLPIDFGGSGWSGLHCTCVAAMRNTLGLEKHPVKIHDMGQMLGYVDNDLADAMEVDVVQVMPPSITFGNAIGEWREWTTPWGQDVLIPKEAALSVDANGDVLIHPQGDIEAPASGRLPKSGFYFDNIIRDPGFDEDTLNPEDNLEEFTVLADSALSRMADSAAIARATGRAVAMGLPNASFSNINNVPGQSLKRPKGIRDLEEWYMSMVTRPEYLGAVFEGQKKIMLHNLQLLLNAVGAANCDVLCLCGADFGTQNGLLCAESVLRELILPHYKEVNAWVHQNTSWKTVKHCCGAVEPLMEFFIDAGFDAVNPVQCSAFGMNPRLLKERYGARLVFWGGGVETQGVLSLGAPEDVRREALERCEIFSKGGGFVFTSVHNVQPLTPVENIMAMLNAVREFNGQFMLG